MPRNERDLLIFATDAWLQAFDNLSGLPNWLSDALCRLSTGGSLSSLALYADSDEAILDAMRPQILTGIDRISSRHDLTDRSIIMNLPPIPEHKRRPEADIWREFEAIRTRVLGALSKAVSAALALLPFTKLDRLPRMADFALWVSAAEAVPPWESGQFMEAYQRNRGEAIGTALAADPVASAVICLMDDRDVWEGTATALLKALNNFVPVETRRLRSWPQAANHLSKRVRRIATFLRTVGIEIDADGKTAGRNSRRVVTIKKSDHVMACDGMRRQGVDRW